MRYIEIFENISHKYCQVNHYNYLDCINMFNNNDYIPIKLSNEYMTITGEIDNINRFTIKNKDRSNLTRITFEDIDYFVFPLIMFKNFHIQFDGEQNIISFYTNDSTILKIKKIVNKNEGEISSILIIIIVIVIILIALFIGFIVYRFIKKRRGLNAEEEINNLHEIINTKNN